MNGNMGIKLKKDYTDILKKFKRYETKRNSKYNMKPNDYFNVYNYNTYDSNDSLDDNFNNNYSFSDMIDSLEHCMESNNDKCNIESCILDKKIKFNKKAFILGFGITLGFVISSCLHKRKNTLM